MSELFAASFILGVFPSVIVNTDVLLLSPLTNAIQKRANDSLTDSGTRSIQLLLYLSKPVDRMIQIVVAPFFNIIGHFGMINYFYREKKTLLLATRVLISPAIPLKIILDIAILFSNIVLQIFIPYQMAYSLFQGKEGVREYFYIRSEMIKSNITFINTYDYYAQEIAPPLLSLKKCYWIRPPEETLHNLLFSGKYLSAKEYHLQKFQVYYV